MVIQAFETVLVFPNAYEIGGYFVCVMPRKLKYKLYNGQVSISDRYLCHILGSFYHIFYILCKGPLPSGEPSQPQMDTFLRGQNVNMDDVTRRELEQKRKKQLEYQVSGH